MNLPKGWRLVPNVPTPEMIDAWCKAAWYLPVNVTDEEANRIIPTAEYQAMLSAAPEAPEQPTQRGATEPAVLIELARSAPPANSLYLRNWDNLAGLPAGTYELYLKPPATDTGHRNTTETLCEDCPPVGYPTDETRCLPCPRKSISEAPGQAAAPAVQPPAEPITEDFVAGAINEAAYQREKWGAVGDAGKAPQDWFWLIGYLSGKALAAHIAGNTEKALHHTISSAAALANWHRAILGLGDMRPGHAPSAAIEAQKEAK